VHPLTERRAGDTGAPCHLALGEALFEELLQLVFGDEGRHWECSCVVGRDLRPLVAKANLVYVDISNKITKFLGVDISPNESRMFFCEVEVISI
jgi:hypothetical protein